MDKGREHVFYTGSEPELGEQMRGWILDGGLAICKVCHNGEGALTTHCPGEVATHRGDDIYSGKIDFVNGKWIEVRQPRQVSMPQVTESEFVF